MTALSGDGAWPRAPASELSANQAPSASGQPRGEAAPLPSWGVPGKRQPEHWFHPALECHRPPPPCQGLKRFFPSGTLLGPRGRAEPTSITDPLINEAFGLWYWGSCADGKGSQTARDLSDNGSVGG